LKPRQCGCTAGSSEVPGRKPVTSDNDDYDDDRLVSPTFLTVTLKYIPEVFKQPRDVRFGTEMSRVPC
jgi:hypothetical protein